MNLDSFKQKAGPLPVWAWSVIIVVGTYVIYTRYKSAKTDNSATDSPTTTDSTGPTADDYLAAQLEADYTLNNTLGVLNSNVGSATTAINANTGATNSNTTAIDNSSGQPKATGNVPRYALISYKGKYMELGKLGGSLVSPAQAYSTHVHPLPVTDPFVNFGGSIFKLSATADPHHETPTEYAAAGRPKPVTVAPNVPVNLAPSKVR